MSQKPKSEKPEKQPLEKQPLEEQPLGNLPPGEQPPEEHPQQTDYLNLPPGVQAPLERPVVEDVQLTTAWRLVFKIHKKSVRIPVTELIIVGRAASSGEQVGLDLSPYGGYRGGVSRKHAQIMLEDGTLYLEDLDSTNGTRINGFQLEPNIQYRLRSGDELEFARVYMTVHFEKPRRSERK